jgi:hypothetical protein
MPGITFSEGSGLVNSVYGKSQEPIRLMLKRRGESFEQNSALNKVFRVAQSSHWGEKSTSMTAMTGFMPVGENGPHPVDSMQEGYSKFLEHTTWKDSFSLSREIMEDAKTHDLRKKPEQFITGYYRTRELFAAALYGAAIQGLAAASFRGKAFDAKTADGKALFASDHPSAVGGAAQSNSYADAFSAAALGAAESAMQDFRGDNGEILDISPDTILIPNLYDLKNDVFAAIGSDKDPANSNNAFNYQYGRWTVIVWPYLNQFISSGTKPWILLDSRYNNFTDCALWLDRTPLDVRSTLDDNTDANVWYGYSRFTAGFVDWRFALAGGTTSTDKLIPSGDDD